MSKQLDLSQPLDQETIDDLLTRHPVEKVEYWVAVSNDARYEDRELYDNDLQRAENEGDYESQTKAQLVDQLERRGLPTSGNKDELVERLQQADSGESED
jgi:SAP domain